MTKTEMLKSMEQDIENWDKIIGPEIVEETDDGYCRLKDYTDDIDYYPFHKKQLDKNYNFGITYGDIVIQNIDQDIGVPFHKGQRWMILSLPPIHYNERCKIPLKSIELHTIAYSVFTLGAKSTLIHINEEGKVDANWWAIVDLNMNNNFILDKRNEAEEKAYQKYIVNKNPIYVDFEFIAL